MISTYISKVNCYCVITISISWVNKVSCRNVVRETNHSVLVTSFTHIEVLIVSHKLTINNRTSSSWSTICVYSIVRVSTTNNLLTIVVSNITPNYFIRSRCCTCINPSRINSKYSRLLLLYTKNPILLYFLNNNTCIGLIESSCI